MTVLRAGEKIRDVAEITSEDDLSYHRLNKDYYGRFADDAGFPLNPTNRTGPDGRRIYERAPGIIASWSMEQITPNSYANAKALAKLAPKIDAELVKHVSVVDPRTGRARCARARLTATKVPGGWRIVEFDYRKFEFTISDR